MSASLSTPINLGEAAPFVHHPGSPDDNDDGHDETPISGTSSSSVRKASTSMHSATRFKRRRVDGLNTGTSSTSMVQYPNTRTTAAKEVTTTTKEVMLDDEATLSAKKESSASIRIATTDSLCCLSVKELLSVPLEMIFRKVTSSSSHATTTHLHALHTNNNKPVMTRNEAHCLVQVSQLSHSVDALVQVAFEALQQRVLCQSLKSAITIKSRANEAIHLASTATKTTAPHVPLVLRSILPTSMCLLSHHDDDTEEQDSSSTSSSTYAPLLWDTIQQELAGVASQLATHSTTLRQSADQNWTLSESMMDTLPESSAAGRQLAREKRLLAQVQEEVAVRIDTVLLCQPLGGAMAHGDNDDDKSHDRDDVVRDFTTTTLNDNVSSMKEYCKNLVQGDSNDNGDDKSAESESDQPQHVPHEMPSHPEMSPAAESSSEMGSPPMCHPPRRDPWSSTTSTTMSPYPLAQKSNSQEIELDKEEGVVEMTQGTQNAVAALAGLMASGHPGR